MMITTSQIISGLIGFVVSFIVTFYFFKKVTKKKELELATEFRLPKTGECIEILEDYREESYLDGRVTLMLFAGEVFTVKNYVGIGDCIETSFGIVSLTALRFCNYKVWEEC